MDVSTSKKKDDKSVRKKRWRLPIAFKLGVSISLLLVLGMAALAWGMLAYQQRANYQQAEEFGDVIAGQLAASVTEPLFAGGQLELDVLLNNVTLNKRIMGAAIFDHEYQLLASSGVLPRPSLIDFDSPGQRLELADFDDDAAFPTMIFKRALLRISPVVYREATGGYVVVALPEASTEAAYKQAVQAVVVIAVLLCCTIIPLALVMGKRMSRPIQRLVEATEAIGSGGVYSIADRRSDEIGELIEAINNMGSHLLHKSEVENRLEMLLSKGVARKVIKNLDTVSIGGEHVNATVLFADIVGFTSISEKLTPQQVSEFLNEFFSYLNRCCRFFFGSIDKYIGDCIMVLFGAHEPDENQQYNAIACAVVMQRFLAGLNKQRQRQGKFPVNLRIGINSGDMVAGMIGSPERMEYTVVGDAVNLASRLCAEADGGQIILEESLYQSISEKHRLDVEEKKIINVRGKSEPVHIYNVRGVNFKRRQLVEDLLDDMVNHGAKL
ncbi:adenylate/guanylate cyclase domain-containing protein [Porticoccus sp. W117]|nr:adenylate/guanylate cyclase domain-containing protein [Porticoccus sp. W117]